MKFLSGRTSANREPGLDIVRGVAILLAIGWHFNHEVLSTPSFDFLLQPGRFIGWAGVDLFFVLSGFLIGRGILAEIQTSGRFRYGAFLIRRVFRLYPVLLLFLLAHLIVNDRPWQSYLPQTLLSIQNYTSTSIPILWSLAVEEHFYLITGVAMLLLPKVGTRPAVLFPALLIIMAGSFILRCIAEINNVDPTVIQWQTQFRMDALAAGVLLAALLTFRPHLFDRVSEYKSALLSLIVIGCLTLLYIRFGGWFCNTFGYTISYSVSAAFIMLLCRAKLSSWARVLSSPLVLLGLWAYPLYIWQFSGVAVSNMLVNRISVLNTPAWRVLLTYVCAIGIAGAISFLIERPFMRWGKTLTSAKVRLARANAEQRQA